MSAGSVNYRSGIRSAIRGLWMAALDYNQFTEGMLSVIHRGIPAAWYEGAAECGILPADLSPEEKTALRQAIFHEENYIGRLAIDIEAGSKANGGLLRPLMARGQVWVNRYEEVRQKAMVMACADLKTRWTLGAAEHCSSCVKLSGKIKRNSYWRRVGILPRVPAAPYLECQGYNCQCTLEPTDEPLSKGPLPRLP